MNSSFRGELLPRKKVAKGSSVFSLKKKTQPQQQKNSGHPNNYLLRLGVLGMFLRVHMGVSLNGGTPKTPQNDNFRRKTNGFVGETHHFRKPPYLLRSLDVIGKKTCQKCLVIPQLRRLGLHRRQSGLQRTVRIIGFILPSIHGWFREFPWKSLPPFKKMVVPLRKMINPLLKKRVVRKPSFIKKRWNWTCRGILKLNKWEFGI